MSIFGNLLISLFNLALFLLLRNNSLIAISFIVLMVFILTLGSYSERVKATLIDLSKFRPLNTKTEKEKFLMKIIAQISNNKGKIPPRVYINPFTESVLSLFSIGRCKTRNSRNSTIEYSGVLIIPEATINSLDEKELCYVVGHEMVHLVQSDSLKFAFASIISTLIPAITVFLLLSITMPIHIIFEGLIIAISIVLAYIFQRKLFFKLELNADKNAIYLAYEACKSLGQDVKAVDFTQAGIRTFTKYGN